jgi:CubicO group peptidase (beta-lactamase class C family)
MSLQRSTRFSLLLAVFTLAAGSTAPAQDTKPAPVLTREQLQELDAWIEKARQEWELPGIAVAIVQGDSVVLAKGYGVRELGKSDPVSEHTLFGIGSNGKTFTSALAAMMVDEGKLRWDDPIYRHLPTFRVADPYVSQNATLRDALSHRTGV